MIWYFNGGVYRYRHNQDYVGMKSKSGPDKEVVMYTCIVSMKLKGRNASEYIRNLEKDILPLLRKQTGFRNEISLVSSEPKKAVAISFWDTKESAEAYTREKYRDVLKILSKTVEGTPRVETFEVANSTSYLGRSAPMLQSEKRYIPNPGRNYEGYVPTSNRNYK